MSVKQVGLAAVKLMELVAFELSFAYNIFVYNTYIFKAFVVYPVFKST